jgi:hypothetical protein
MNEDHYVCTGDCGGISPTPKVCEDATCSKSGEPMIPCSCDDGLHEITREKEEGEE